MARHNPDEYGHDKTKCQDCITLEAKRIRFAEIDAKFPDPHRGKTSQEMRPIWDEVLQKRQADMAAVEARGEVWDPFKPNVMRLGSIDNPAPQHVGANAPETSRAALEKLPAQGTKRRITYELIREAGTRGLCDHEIEALTGWLHQSASAVRNALMNDGHIRASSVRRLTPSGNDAIAWVVAVPSERA